MDQLASLLEGERAEAFASLERESFNVLDTLRDDYFLESAVFEAAFVNDFQLGTRLECDFTQLFTAIERTFSELSDGTRNEYSFYVAVSEPISSYDFQPAWKTQHFRILVEAQLLPRHLYVRRKTQLGDSSPPKTEPAKILNIRVQLECLQIVTLSKGHRVDLTQ